MSLPQRVVAACASFPPIEVDLVSFTCTYGCCATRTLLTLHYALLLREHISFLEGLFHTYIEVQIPSLKHPCLRGPDLSLKALFVLRSCFSS